MRSSHLPGTAGQAMCPSAVLLRIEFTSPNCLQPARALLPHVSTLTSAQAPYPSPRRKTARLAHFAALRPAIDASINCKKDVRRYLSVALVRGFPLAGVTRYPCPVEPGLSSRTGFRLVPAAVRLTRAAILIEKKTFVNIILVNKVQKRYNTFYYCL